MSSLDHGDGVIAIVREDDTVAVHSLDRLARDLDYEAANGHAAPDPASACGARPK